MNIFNKSMDTTKTHSAYLTTPSLFPSSASRCNYCSHTQHPVSNREPLMQAGT